MKKKIVELGHVGFEFNTRFFDCNYVIQALEKLIKHPIIKKGDVTSYIPSIKSSIVTNHNEKKDSEALLEFIDFLSLGENKMFIENKDIKKNLGSILTWCNNYNIDAKKDFIKHLNKNPELLKKGVNLASYIQYINNQTYKLIIEAIHLPNAPKTPESIIFENFQKIPEKSQRVEEVVNITNLKKQNYNGKLKGFARVGGQTKAIEAIQKKVIFPRKFPELYRGIKPEKGAILYGPPGTGKSLLAEALSEECDRYFIKIGASDMSEKFVGASEENWRNLFKKLKENQPAILFIDEADSLCKKRGGQDIHGDKELNQFLKLMSDLKSENADVYVLLATNNFKTFDEAILRDGRFGTHIEMLPPQNMQEVEEIFNIHKNDLKFDKDIDENKEKIFKKILEYKLTGAGIEGMLKDSHDAALKRLGLIEKMKTNNVSSNDINNFSINLEDILLVLEERKPSNTKTIGFIN